MKARKSLIEINKQTFIVKDISSRKKLAIWKDGNRLGKKKTNQLLDKYDRNVASKMIQILTKQFLSDKELDAILKVSSKLDDIIYVADITNKGSSK